jgi:hypothetical protein
MPPAPAPQDPGRDDPRRVPPWPDWMDDPAYLAGRELPPADVLAADQRVTALYGRYACIRGNAYTAFKTARGEDDGDADGQGT